MVNTVASYLGDIKVAMEMANKKGDEQLKLKQQREKEEQLKIAEKKVIEFLLQYNECVTPFRLKRKLKRLPLQQV